MPKVNYMTGEYLTTKDKIHSGMFVKFIDEGEYVEKEFQGKKKQGFEIGIELPDGTTKKSSLNATSFNYLIEYYGDDTSKWVGKDGRIDIRNQKVGAEFKDIIYITPPQIDAAGKAIKL
jgi:hypothetical protein